MKVKAEMSVFLIFFIWIQQECPQRALEFVFQFIDLENNIDTEKLSTLVHYNDCRGSEGFDEDGWRKIWHFKEFMCLNKKFTHIFDYSKLWVSAVEINGNVLVCFENSHGQGVLYELIEIEEEFRVKNIFHLQ